MKHLRKFWVSLVLLFTVDVHAISIDLIPDHNILALGDTLAVQVKINGLNDRDAPSLGVYDLDFNFNSSLFSFNNLTWGDTDIGNQLDLNGFGSLQSSSIGIGIVNIFELSFDDAASLNEWQAGEFTLFTLIFDTLAPGSGNFSLIANALGDVDGNGLITNLGSTSATIGTTPVPEPSSLLLLLGLLAVVALRTKLSNSGQ